MCQNFTFWVIAEHLDIYFWGRNKPIHVWFCSQIFFSFTFGTYFLNKIVADFLLTQQTSVVAAHSVFCGTEPWICCFDYKNCQWTWKSRTQRLNNLCFLYLELLLHTLTISPSKQNVVTATVKEFKTTNAKLCCQNREEKYFFKPEVGTIPGFSPHLSLCSPHSQVINYQKGRREIKCKIMQVEIKMHESCTPRWIHLLGDSEVYSCGFCIPG